MRLQTTLRARIAAFTLAEVAVTIAIVGLILVFVLQGINESKLLAAHTRNQRLARELGLLTLSQIGSYLFKDEIRDDRLEGNYADEGYPEFAFEAVLGDKTFRDRDPNTGAFDNWRTEAEKKNSQTDATTDETTEQPYEKVQVKVTFPGGADDDPKKNQLVLEQWLPWKQVHPDLDATKTGTSSSSSGSSQPSGSSPPTSGG